MAAYDPNTYEPVEAVPGLIARIRANSLDLLEERLAPLDLKAQDYLVLVTLASGAVETAANVCSVLAHDPGAMTRKIDGLEKRGLVRRVRSEEDRRAIKLELTPEGKKVYPKALAVGASVANDVLEGFSKSEVKALEGLLRRVLENSEAQAAVKA
jgi:DNA-binding MarR family transcriptional regulator